jgi:hypothetical protein
MSLLKDSAQILAIWLRISGMLLKFINFLNIIKPIAKNKIGKNLIVSKKCFFHLQENSRMMS